MKGTKYLILGLSFPPISCFFVWHLPSPWVRAVKSLHPYSFFPGHSWIYTPLSHPPSVYLPADRRFPVYAIWELFLTFDPACHPSPHQLGSILWARGRQEPGLVLWRNTVTGPRLSQLCLRAFFSTCNHLSSWHFLRIHISVPGFPPWGAICPKYRLFAHLCLKLCGSGMGHIPSSAGGVEASASLQNTWNNTACLCVCSGSKNLWLKLLLLKDVKYISGKKANNSMQTPELGLQRWEPDLMGS